MKNAIRIVAIVLSVAMGTAVPAAASSGTGRVCADILANPGVYSVARVRQCQKAEGVSPTYHRGQFERRGGIDNERGSGTAR